ncbi:MAG: glycosyltransferase family 4 protein [Rivularia sp. (in: cyanobacteria)]
MSEKLRILYAVGPEDVIEAYKYWVQNQDAPSQVSVPYSSQFYEVCQALDAKAYVIAQSNKSEFIQNGRFTIERRPIPLASATGLLYHFRQVWCGLILLFDAIRFKADFVIISSGTTHWFVLYLFSLMGHKIIPSIHCVLWAKYLPIRLADKLSLKLSRNLFASKCEAMLAVSHDITEQIAQLTDGEHQPVLEFFPSFRRKDFENIPEPSQRILPFRVLFAGRIEENKGVFDLLSIMKRFVSEGMKDIVFDICGSGSALESLRLEVKQAAMEDNFICHGHCSKNHMREIFGRSHVVIVPTKKEFSEGFNRVVCESILSGRPVVTSSVCPALSYVKDAVVEVPADDIKAYGDALLKLYSNKLFYEQKKQGCSLLQEQFYDPSKSWGTALKSIVLSRNEKQIKLTTNEVVGNF